MKNLLIIFFLTVTLFGLRAQDAEQIFSGDKVVSNVQYHNTDDILEGVVKENSNLLQEDKATVYFIRSTGFAGSASAFTAFIDKELVCKLNNKKYSIHEVQPGEHSFTVQFAGKKAKKKAEPILINLEAGKIYYIQMVFQSGAFKNNLYCQEVTENSAKTILVDCEEDLKCF